MKKQMLAFLFLMVTECGFAQNSNIQNEDTISKIELNKSFNRQTYFHRQVVNYEVKNILINKFIITTNEKSIEYFNKDHKNDLFYFLIHNELFKNPNVISITINNKVIKYDSIINFIPEFLESDSLKKSTVYEKHYTMHNLDLNIYYEFATFKRIYKPFNLTPDFVASFILEAYYNERKNDLYKEHWYKLTHTNTTITSNVRFIHEGISAETILK
jgi:hypothetical protein